LKNHWIYNEQGQRTGVQKYYHENGKIMIEGAWQDGKESGAIKEFYENGKIKSERFFNDGKFDQNKSTTYKKEIASKEIPKEDTTRKVVEDQNKDDSRIVIKASKFENTDQIPFDGNGHYVLRNKEGKVVREGEFENGYLVDGKVFQYTSDGNIFRITYYRGGRVIKVDNKQD